MKTFVAIIKVIVQGEDQAAAIKGLQTVLDPHKAAGHFLIDWGFQKIPGDHWEERTFPYEVDLGGDYPLTGDENERRFDEL